MSLIIEPDVEVSIAEIAESELDEKNHYAVFLLYHEKTPMLFVVELLERFFDISRETAILMTMDMYQLKQPVKCGVYSRIKAEEKKNAVEKYAKEHHHLVECVIKQA
ncbi:MAG: ATP-dependent Clp protease adaptor ClpS [Gammaproteobacteria bacterium]|nr:ATP-dependent Clp protease adaptor ClpS [Gammaproteobacteria bacterium]